MLVLSTVDHTLQAVFQAVGELSWYVAYADHGSSSFTLNSGGGVENSASTGATLVAAPASGDQRLIKSLNITNTGTVSRTVRVAHVDSGTFRYLTPTITLLIDESLHYQDAVGWRIIDGFGRVKVSNDVRKVTGKALGFYKTGGTVEATGQKYFFWQSAGYPGAYVPGTPGMSGRATNGLDSADFGCLPLWTPSSGELFLDQLNFTASTVCTITLVDLLWVNSGIAPTTTTAQTIDSVALPSRDINGSSDGVGVYAALTNSGGTTNGSTVSTIMISYTNSDGVSGRTGRIPLHPATAVSNTFMIFTLQDGDRGIQSIQSITLGTSLGGGTIYLMLYRPLASTAVFATNGGSSDVASRGVKIYPDSCLLILGSMTAVTAVNISGEAVVVER